MSLDFDDLDHFQEVAKGWNLEFIQLDRGALRGYVDIAQSNRVMLIHTQLNRAFHQEGLSPDLGRTFGILASPQSEVSLRGRQVAQNTVSVFPVDRAFEGYSSSGFDAHIFTLHPTLLEQVAELYELQEVLESLPHNGDVFVCRLADVNALRWTARGIHSSARRISVVMPDLEFEVARLFLWTLRRHTARQNAPPYRKRDRAFRAGVDIIMERFDDDLSIPQVASIVGASERTLRYALEEKIGVSPKTFLQLVRLRQARSALLNADPAETSVQEIALRYGFGHLGEFSRNYRQMFDELPSHTLRKYR